MARQEFLRREAPSSFKLEAQDAQGLLLTTDHDSLFIRSQEFPRRATQLLFDSCLPYFHQAWFGGGRLIEKSSRPRSEGANSVPERAGRLGPIQAAILFGDLARIARALGRLRSGNDFTSYVIGH